MMIRSTFALRLATTSALIAVGAPAWAQAGAPTAPQAQPSIADQANAGTPSQAAAASAGDTGGVEIVVTAQRRAENIQNVPVSLVAVTADSLKSRSLNDLSQISLAAPSLQLSSDNNYSIRGIGTLAFSTTVDPSVAISLDEVNYAKPLLGGSLFNDVARVEVLDGPQGLLFGKNASAGLLNVITNRPKIGKFEGSVDGEYSVRDSAPGYSDGIISRGTVNIPVSGNSALRLNVVYGNQDPITKYVGTGASRVQQGDRQLALKAKYLYAPTEQLEFYVIGDYSRERGIAGYFDRTYRSVGAGGIDGAPLAGDNITAGPKNLYYGGDGNYFRNLETGGAQGQVTYTFANGFALTNIAAWRYYHFNSQFDADFTSGDGASLNRLKSDYNQYSDELRLTLPSQSRLSGQLGLYAFHSDLGSNSKVGVNDFLPSFVLPTFPFCVGATVTPGGPPNCSVSNSYFLGTDSRYKLHSDSFAAFGQLTYKITDAWRLIGGARVTYDKIKIDLFQNEDNYFVPSLRGEFRDNAHNTNFTYKVGTQYDLTRDIMAYFTYATGYKGPGFNSTASSLLNPLAVKPETSRNYELGLRSAFFQKRLVFNVSLFKSTFSDYQTQAFDPSINDYVIQNAATLKSKGAEVTVIARPLRGLNFNGSATFLDSKFGNFPGAQCYPGQADASCAVNGTFNAAGHRTPNAPKFTSSMQISYDFAVTGNLSAFVEGNYYHRSSINYLVSGAPQTALGAIDTLGGSVGLHPANDKWRVAIFCKNCTNQYSPNFLGLEAGDFNAGVATAVQQLGYNSIRTIGISGTVKF